MQWNRGTLVCWVLAAAVLVLVSSVATRAAAPLQFPTVDYLTFQAPVSLPGVTLGSGEYSFQVNHVDSGNAVQVRHRSTNRLVFLGFTERVQRPRAVAAGTVTLGEARAGEAPPVLVWYPTASSLGFRFLHDERAPR